MGQADRLGLQTGGKFLEGGVNGSDRTAAFRKTPLWGQPQENQKESKPEPNLGENYWKLSLRNNITRDIQKKGCDEC